MHNAEANPGQPGCGGNEVKKVSEEETPAGRG
jgi:hypothetical protein